MYRGRLERDLAQWVRKGMLDATSAEALLAEYDSRPASFSLSRVLMVLAALLLGCPFGVQRLLAQNTFVQGADCGPGVDAEILGEGPLQSAIGFQRVGLALEA